MSQEISVPKASVSNSWNVVRSKSIPSGVSGSHTAANQKPSFKTDTSILNQDSSALPGHRRSTLEMESAGSPAVKQ